MSMSSGRDHKEAAGQNEYNMTKISLVSTKPTTVRNLSFFVCIAYADDIVIIGRTKWNVTAALSAKVHESANMGLAENFSCQ